MPKMPREPQWLRAGFSGRIAAVDRDKQVIRGYVLAQEGPFKSAGRGAFDRDALQEIVRLGNATRTGLKSRFAHPTLSDDGLGKHLGRAKNLRLDTALDARTGRTVAAVRGDLHFDPSASKTPSGDLADYVLSLAESDPDALSSSLVLEADEEVRLDAKKRPLTDADGNDLPPLWRPTRLHASDIVDTGDAVDGLLSANLDASALPDAAVRKGCQLLDSVFHGQDWEVVEARCLAWLARYREHRGVQNHRWESRVPLTQELIDDIVLKPPTPALDAYRLRLEQMALDVRKRKEK
jgi:hypothetical protein